VLLAGALAIAATAASSSRVRRGLTARRAIAVATSAGDAIPWWQRLTRQKTEKGVGIWCEKLNMTTWFEDGPEGKATPATILVVKKGGNIITGKKWPEKHGYYAITVGYDRYVPEEWEAKGGRAKALAKLAANDLPPLKKEREFRVRPQDWEKWNIGDKVKISDLFKEGDAVDIRGRTKGKGFCGAIKAHGHRRGPMTHGSKHHRRYGSVGMSATPSRVFPFKKMATWVGDKMTVQKRLKILKVMDQIDEDNMPETIIVVKGSVPGYIAHFEAGGSYLNMTHAVNTADGRYKRDPVWLYYVKRGDETDPYVPIRGQAWTWKTVWGRDIRWYKQEEKKYWPDGFPGYDHSEDPFYDGCDEKKAIKAPEW